MMTPKLYIFHASPPVRAVLMTARAIGLQLEQKTVKLFHEEHMTPDYLEINPQHTIPTLIDDGFVVWDSQAIITYLVSKYAKDDSLYPKDLKKRALINQRLYFNSSVAFHHLQNIAKMIFWHFHYEVDKYEEKRVFEAYDFLEMFLEGNDWVAGDFTSIADYSLIATISTLNIVVPITDNYKNILGWIQKCKALEEYEANVKGLKEAGELFKARLRKNFY